MKKINCYCWAIATTDLITQKFTNEVRDIYKTKRAVLYQSNLLKKFLPHRIIRIMIREVK